MNERSFKFIFVKIAVAGCLLLGLSGIVAYLPGFELLGRVRSDYIPMAPSTSCSFIVLSLATLGLVKKNLPILVQRIVVIAIALAAIFGLLEFLQLFSAIDLSLEDKIFPELGTMNGVPVGRMSPSTGFLFFFSGTTLLCLFLSKNRSDSNNRNLNQMAGILSSLVLFSAVTFVLGYAYGTPLLYGNHIIPMAFTTAIGFGLLGVALIASNGRDFYPLSSFSGSSTRALLMRAFLPLIIFVVLVQGVVVRVFPLLEGVNEALFSAFLVVFYALLAGIVVNKVSKKVGDQIDLAEAALLSSKRRLQEVVSKSPIPIFLINYNGEVELLNQAFTRVLGYTINDIGTMDSWWRLAYPDLECRQKSQEEWNRVLTEAQSTGGDVSLRYKEVQHKDGGLRTVEFRTMPLDDIVIITMIDLTEHLLLVKELTEGEVRLSEAQRLAHLGCWEWDIVKGTLWWSDEVYRIFGLQPDQLKMTYELFLQAVHPDDRQYVQSSIDLALVENNPYSIEHRIVLPDGKIKTVHERGKVTRDDETPVYMMGTVQDISERKILERQLIQATKMESIGQLAAGVAHEINTPTQFIQHNVSFFQEAFSDIILLINDYEKLRDESVSDSRFSNIHTIIKKRSEDIEYDYLISEVPKAIEQSLEGLSQIMRIVQSVKLFAHTSSVEKVAVDINNLIDTVITVSTNEWKYHSDVHLDLDRIIPPVFCVPDQISQALLNIVINAAHTNNDKVQSGDVNKAGIFVSTKLEEDFIIISIRDEGMGIRADVQDKIFNPFFTTKELGKGTGQGLALAYRAIVDGHGGTIDFETVVGEGTVFTVKLPLVQHKKGFTN
ncbi:PAS domain S-box-containing protein [Maridesulfovibrio ferrireducens]|uniref:histidine kinase n=1 Tax=Maridesulfovibrio ferrireducens TaxID=246191 RepID=A0A1G9JSV0_9BACT|nr:PAS domain-containing sensor histidine kinase [Maridesulfovibrio ferrireducens]SDL40531.1 PAS domain S-box-containing protein [Maridesulfovibrio ferrireducens]